ncbi:MAG: hypothetical protein KJ630_02235 [Proteobacteria bacterium]|nr:hypothetical protein [Pseudomonadota bacterium]
MNDQQLLLHLQLTVVTEKLPLFTTVLQSGIEIMTPAGSGLGQFLSLLPGFTAEYLSNTVQTIFHNGTAVDDLTTLLCGERPVLALSAAMPGLAGAIFRKDSFHKALRSETKNEQPITPATRPLTVTLKLFNVIAQERGKELFAMGVCLPAAVLSSFFIKRPALLQEILQIQLDGKGIDIVAMQQLLSSPAKIHLKIFDTMAIPNG